MAQMTVNTGSPTPAAPEKKPAARFRKALMIVIIAPLAVMATLVVLAVLLSLADVKGVSEFMRSVRDLLLIFIALELAMIFLGISVLFVQIARLVNLLTEEVQPLLETTQDTVQTAQGTVDFASRNFLRPAIDAASFTAALSVLVGGLFGLRRAYGRATKREE